ncbi:MAG: SpaH/EbpB family LPXTG-anchored major pilin [Acutalibacteraceae bacterium]
MKHLKKFAGVVLAIMIAFAMSIPAFAAQEGTLTGGSITVSNAKANQTYNIYQIMCLESYNKDAGTYTYKANSAWETWLRTQTSYVSFDAQGYITWVTDADPEAFAKAALTEAKRTGSGITADGTNTPSSDGEITFSGLKLGYYLVDTTVGTLCSLNTTNPTMSVTDKNKLPTNTKTVSDSEDGTYSQENDVNIGDTVYFKSTIDAKKGAQNYVLHDKMDAGLTFGGTVTVTKGGTAVDVGNYSLVTSGLTDGCKFEVRFTQAFCDTLVDTDTLVVSYSAVLNENAVIGTEGNKNTSYLTYGDNATSTGDSTTTTKTWSVNVFKYAVKDSADIALSGAKFQLTTDGTNAIALIDKGSNTYRKAKSGETGTITEITTDTTGKFKIEGLDSGAYKLVETVAPAGYNKLSGPVDFSISGTDGSVTYGGNTVDEVKVLNQAGSQLPTTGGIGTTIFYVVGGSVIAVALVLLVVRKRRQSKVAD